MEPSVAAVLITSLILAVLGLSVTGILLVATARRWEAQAQATARLRRRVRWLESELMIQRRTATGLATTYLAHESAVGLVAELYDVAPGAAERLIAAQEGRN